MRDFETQAQPSRILLRKHAEGGLLFAMARQR
jgi:hypothetical protein